MTTDCDVTSDASFETADWSRLSRTLPRFGLVWHHCMAILLLRHFPRYSFYFAQNDTATTFNMFCCPKMSDWIQRSLSGHYRAMLCIRGTSHGPVSVCLSVTSRCSTKTAKRRITQTTPHDTPGSLVFWCQRSPRNSTGVTPYEGAECRWGGSKSATFDIYPAISRKR